MLLEIGLAERGDDGGRVVAALLGDAEQALGGDQIVLGQLDFAEIETGFGIARMAAQISVEVDFRGMGFTVGHVEMRVREQVAVVEEHIAAGTQAENSQDGQTDEQGAAHGGNPREFGRSRSGQSR